jgi:CMP-N-acetylneuraminic acid synthetase
MHPQKSLAIIPARGDSKSIPNKNIALLAGKPLIAYTIQSAREANCLDRMIVNTDSQEIAEIARLFGVEVPFLRPRELAQDNTPTLDVILHTLSWVSANDGYSPDYVIILQPTSPLRSADDIRNVVTLMTTGKTKAVVSVSTIQKHPYWMKTIDKNGELVDFLEDTRRVTRRQDLPEVYALNGAIYCVSTKEITEKKTLLPSGTYAYIMPEERSLDIDTPWDLHLAELILSS